MAEKKDEAIVAVYKLHLHCKECARLVEKEITKTSGVQKVDVDVTSGKVNVKGVFDVTKLQKRIETKTRKKVELISPKPKEPKDDQKPPVKNEPKKEEVIRTTVLKVYIHCQKCEHDLKSKMLEHKGIHKFDTNRNAQTCTVVGTIEEKELIKYLHKRTGKHGEVVSQKVEKKAEEKEDVKKMKVEVKESDKVVVAAVDRKEEETKGKDPVVVPYFVHCTHAPDEWCMFSDENPNACSVM